jgi:hypothetical protein
MSYRRNPLDLNGDGRVNFKGFKRFKSVYN